MLLSVRHVVGLVLAVTAATSLLELVVGTTVTINQVAATTADQLIIPTICAPFITPPVYAGIVPSPSTILGFPLGSQPVTPNECDEVINMIASASSRVITGIAAYSVQGRPLTYAIISDEGRMNEAELSDIRAAISNLTNPFISPTEAQAIIDTYPTILWVAANVHGYEMSGSDASLQLLYDLSDRTDCVATTILSESIVVLLPIQNPDGRVAGTRRNANMFDMNRDYFARSQPETDGKIELLRTWLPQLYIDSHEMPLTTYFFPPNDDPIHHEVPKQTLNWINNIYGAACQNEFKRQNISFFNLHEYDLFVPEYGDTTGTIGFHAAGMTYEKSDKDPFPQRVKEQYVAILTSVFAGASQRQQILGDWYQSFVDAAAEGAAGILQPNRLVNPNNTLYQQVPSDIVVRQYWLLEDPARTYEIPTLIRQLQRMDIVVYQLDQDLEVIDFSDYRSHSWSDPSPYTLPSGTYYVSLNQSRKHWLQGMLGHEGWVSLGSSYDVTGFSQPLLYNIPVGYSGDPIDPSTAPMSLVGQLPIPAAPTAPAGAPRIGILEWDAPSVGVGAFETIFWSQWNVVPLTTINATQVISGLQNQPIDILILPDGDPDEAVDELGQIGLIALNTWVIQHGGRVISMLGGTQLAIYANISSVILNDSGSNSMGSLLRFTIDPKSRLATDILLQGETVPTAWAIYQDDPVMSIPVNHHTCTPKSRSCLTNRNSQLSISAVYPSPSDPSYGVSGFTSNMTSVYDSAAIVEEFFPGGGWTVAMAFDPAFRAWSRGLMKLVWNGMFAPVSAHETLNTHNHQDLCTCDVEQSVAAVEELFGSHLRVEVPAVLVEEVRTALADDSYRDEPHPHDSTRHVFKLKNPARLDAEAHPAHQTIRQLLLDSARSNVTSQ